MRRIQGKMDKNLISNTLFLYLLTFSTYLFGLATVPYLTRVLGAITYGKTGVALAYMSYVAIIMDLGFILSATQKVVENKNNLEYIGKLLFSVTAAKTFLGIIVTILFISYVLISDNMRSDLWFYLFYLIAYLVNAFLPDFFYRGIEKMKVITYRTLLVKAIFMCSTFVLVRQETDYWKVPLITLIGNSIAIVIMYYDLWKNYHVKMYIAPLSEVVRHVRDTIPFFISRIASTVYQALNTIILSLIYGNSAVIGYYTSADKIISLSKTGSSPIADSLYPYMIRERNFKLVKRFLLITMPIILIGGVFLFVFAEPICCFLFGNGYAEAGNILRCLLPIMVVILPTYILCFPVMVPLGLSKYANFSNVLGMSIQIAGLILLIIKGVLNVYSICILSSITEVGVFTFRLLVVLIHIIKKEKYNRR